YRLLSWDALRTRPQADRARRAGRPGQRLQSWNLSHRELAAGRHDSLYADEDVAGRGCQRTDAQCRRRGGAGGPHLLPRGRAGGGGPDWARWGREGGRTFSPTTCGTIVSSSPIWESVMSGG